MVKIHNNKLTIINCTGQTMELHNAWFDSGRIGDGYEWPRKIQDGEEKTILCYERNWSMAGCSGYVQYKLCGMILTIGFSNPSAGSNKIGVGYTGRKVWEEMTSNDYQQQFYVFPSASYEFRCSCVCSGGETNIAEVVLNR